MLVSVDQLLSLAPVLTMAGIAAGLLAGLLGVGGGLVIVPAIYFVLQSVGVDSSIAMSIAISSSLVSILPTAISSSYAHYRLGNICWPYIRRWALFVLLGVTLGIYWMKMLPGDVLAIVFAVFMWLMAIKILLKPKRVAQVRYFNSAWHAVIGFIVGLVSSLVGVGGGAMSVPIFKSIGLTIHQSVGTSAVIGMLISIGASIQLMALSPHQTIEIDGVFGLVFIPALLILAPVTVLMAPVGARIGKRCSEAALSMLFSVLLFAVGGKIVWGSFF